MTLKKNGTMKHLNKWIAIGLVVVAMILINVIGAFTPGQIDVTSNRMFTLSEGSRSLLSKLDEPVILRYYFSRSAEGAPIAFKNYASRVEDLLRQYESASSGMVRLEVINPRPDTPEEEAAIRAGLSGQPLPTGDSIFFGLLAIQADQEEVIAVFSPQREQFLEFDISQLIYRVQQLEKPTLGLITSLDVFGNSAGNLLGGGGGSGEWVVVEQLRYYFNVRRVRGDSFPDDLDVLAVIHPGDLSDSLLYGIDQFVLSGKAAFIAVDPSSYTQRMGMSGEDRFTGMGGNTSSDLSLLFSQWGIEFDSTRVVGDMELAATVNTGAGRTRFPIWLQIEEFNEEAPPTAQLNQVLFAEAGSFTLEAGAEDLEFTSLISSSSGGGAISTSMLTMNDPERIARSLEPGDHPKVLAGVLRGTLTTAFPDGPPPAEDEEEAEEETSEEALTKSTGSSTIVLVGDSDFLTDDFSVRIMDYMGQRAMAPLNDNLAFLSNTLDYLAGSEDLIGLRGKGTAVRPFERVRAMEVSAQERYQQQLDALDERLEKVQERLNELQARQTEQGQLVASPEMEETIEEFRFQETEMRAERREIRKKLREDVEGMKLRLAMFNLLTVPVLVLIYGVVFFTIRSRRTKRS